MAEGSGGDVFGGGAERRDRQGSAARVLVVGGGIGGMAAAIALRQRDMAPEIVEIDPDWTVYGAGITITGPTLRAFRDLRLLDAIAREGAFVSGNRMFLFDGTFLAEQAPPPVAPDLPSSGGIMRPALHRIMSDEVLRQGIPVRLGVTVERVDADGDGPAEVSFSDGTDGRYELVVGADGIYSQIRTLCFPDAVRPSYTGQMIWRVVADRPPAMDKAEFFFGHERIGGIIPCAKDKVYAFVLHPGDTPARYPEAEQAKALRKMMEPFGGSMAVVREGVGPRSSIVHRPFEYALQPAPWHRGRVVLIGDAAHATTPHLASGAGMAVEDAIVLSEELSRPGVSMDRALAAFTDRRLERCRFIVETSVAIGRAQLDLAPPHEIGQLMAKGMHRLAEAI